MSPDVLEVISWISLELPPVGVPGVSPRTAGIAAAPVEPDYAETFSVDSDILYWGLL